MSVSMTMNGAVLPIMAFYINAGLEDVYKRQIDGLCDWNVISFN